MQARTVTVQSVLYKEGCGWGNKQFRIPKKNNIEKFDVVAGSFRGTEGGSPDSKLIRPSISHFKDYWVKFTKLNWRNLVLVKF